MRAMVVGRYGAPEVLESREVADPQKERFLLMPTRKNSNNGTTRQGGYYTVIGCFDSFSYLMTGSFISSPTVSGVPQFPLGLFALFAVMVPALLLFRKRFTSANVEGP